MAASQAWLWQLYDASSAFRLGAWKVGSNDLFQLTDVNQAAFPGAATITEADGWQMLVVRHQTSGGIKGSRCVMSGPTWTHNAASGTTLATPGAIGSLWLGSNAGAAGFWDGRIAAWGCSNTYMADADVESLSNGGLASIWHAALGGGEVFLLGQDDETDTVTGSVIGESQIARTNTNAVTDLPAGWAYDE